MGSIWPEGEENRSQESEVRSCRMGSPLTGSVNGHAGFDLASGRFDDSTNSAEAFAP